MAPKKDFKSKSSKKAEKDLTGINELKKALKQKQLGTLYVFHGEEPFLQEYYLKQIRSTLLPPGLESFNHHTARGKECSLDWLEQTIDCMPMMSERTLVEVEDWDIFSLGQDDTPKLINLLEDIPEYCCLVFVYDTVSPRIDARTKLAKLLKKCNGNVIFYHLEQNDLVDWITRTLRAEGKQISYKDAVYLVFHCGTDMTNLSSELAKLCSYVTKPTITQADIDAVTIPVIEAMVYNMTNAIAGRDFNAAAAVLSDLLNSAQDPYMLLAVVGKYFRQLYYTRLGLGRGITAKDLMDLWGMKEYPAQKLLEAAPKFSVAWCRYAVRRCAEVSIDFRLFYKQEPELLSGLLMELATGRRIVG